MDILIQFRELEPFKKEREQHFDDDDFMNLQKTLMMHPECGPLIKGASGFRKLRFASKRRNAGKRGGIRVIYYYRAKSGVIYLASIIDKVEVADLTERQKKDLHVITKILENES